MSFHPVTKAEFAQCLFDYVAKRDGKGKTVHLCSLFAASAEHPTNGFCLELAKLPESEVLFHVELKDTNWNQGGDA